MKQLSQTEATEGQLHTLTLTNDDKTVLLSDQNTNLISINVEDASKPEIKFKEKIEGIGIPSCIHADADDELLLIGASKGLEFIVYDFKQQQIVNRVHGH